MMSPSHHSRGLFAAAVVSASLALAACSPAGTTPAGPGPVVDLQAARAFIDPYTRVTPFTVTEPLEKPLSADTRVVYVDVGTAVAALQAEALQDAATTMGVQLTVVPSAPTPLEISNTLDSIVELRPDILIVVAIDPQLYAAQLETLRAAGTLVVTSAVVNGEDFGFGADVMSGRQDANLVGEIMAADILAQGEGKTTEVAFYTSPELAFTAAVQEGVEAKFAELCPACTLRVVEIPITELGSTAPQTIVSDLQSNPRTGGMVFAFDDLQLGLPPALKVAGLDVPGIGWAPTAPNLDAIEQGTQYAGIGLDLPVQMWSLLDQAARERAGQELSGEQKLGHTVKQIVVAGNVPAETSKGWSGYPDYRERFAALWSR